MTVLDALLDKGLTCPVCGETLVIGFNLQQGHIKCETCEYRFEYTYHSRNASELIVAWLVLTGGPIPGSIPPPENQTYSVFYNMDWWRLEWRFTRWVGLNGDTIQPKCWMLMPRQRTIEGVTEWLGRKIDA